MREKSGYTERKTKGAVACQEPDGLEEMRAAVHALSQPLTALCCRLELALLDGSLEAFQKSVRLGLEDCARTTELVTQIWEKMATLNMSLGRSPLK